MQTQAQSDLPCRAGSFGQVSFSDAGHAHVDGAFCAGAAGRGVVVLDHAVSDPGAFLAAVPPGFEVVWLGPSADPIAALSRALDGAPPFGSLHVVSHGRPGALLLAGTSIDAETLRRRRAEVEAIGRRLGSPADVFLYGCEVAAGAEGRRFVETLASLLGASVSASATPTGSALLGGDWGLEVSAGRPMERPIFGPREMAGYHGVLAAPNVTDNTGWVDVIKRAGFDPAGDPQAGTAGVDLRGDTTNALLQAQSFTDSGGTDYTGFRVLYDGSTPGPYYFIGFDVDNDGALDAFLGVEPSGNGAGVYVYDADPGQANNSPSTTGIIDSNSDPRIALANASFGSVAAGAGTSHLVVWVPTADLTNAIAAKTGVAVTASSPMNYLVFSATQDNSINGDLGGAATNSNATFASLGVFTSQSLASPAAASVPAPANLSLAQDTGANGSDSLTSDGSVTGTAQPGATVTLREGATVLGTATADSAGQWTITPAGLAQGAHTVEAVATDSNGNASPASAGLTYNFDSVAPAVAITSAGGLTNQAAQTVAGTAEPGSSVTLREGAVVLGTVTAGAGGTWSLAVTLSGDGTHNLTATATDAAGNTGGPTAAVAYSLDTQAPGAAPALSATDDVGPATGALPNGARTDDTDLAVTVSLTGTGAQAGDTVRLYDGAGTASPLGGAYTLTAADIAAGQATLQTGTLSDGTTYGLTARITDAAGNQGGASGPFAATVDTAAPAAPAITGFAPDTGQAGDGITAGDGARQITLAGTAEAGSTVTITASKDGGPAFVVGTAVATGGGAWSLPTNALADGGYVFTATATDAAGNTGAASAARNVAVDATAPSTAPAIASVSDDAGPVTGALPSGASTDDADLTVQVDLAGTGAQAGDTVQLYDGPGTAFPVGGAHVLTAADIAAGRATLQTGPLSDGATYDLTVRLTDAAGNLGAASAIAAVTEDRTAPAVAITSPGGPTNQAAQTVAGTAEPGSTVQLYLGGALVGTAQADGNGGWTSNVTLPGEGAHALTATATDAVGNTGGPASPAAAYVLDTTLPAVTAGLSNDDGVSATDAVTSDAGLAGTGEPGATVTIMDGPTVLATATVDGSGNWSVPGSALGLPDGAHTLTASETDAAGNTGTATVAFTLSTVPLAPSVSALATNDTTPALSGSWGGANGGTDTLSVTVNGTTYTAGVSPALQVNGTAWLLQLPGPLADGAYDVTAAATRAGGGSAQATANGALTVDTVAPVVSLGLTRDSNAFDTVGIVRTEALTGTGTPGATLSFFDGGAAIGTAVADANGAWTFKPPGLGDGARTIVVQETDAAGNVGSASLEFRPIASPAADAGGDSVTEWRSMDLARLLNDGGKLQLPAGTERAVLADGTLSVGNDTNEAFLTRMYFGLLGRAPEAEGISWWQDGHEQGASRSALADGFLRTVEHAAGGGNGGTDAQFVQDLYQGVLGRGGAGWEVALWTARLDAGETRGAVLAGIADSPEAKGHWAAVVAEGVWVRDADAAVVRVAYLAGFGREAEADGLRFWAGALEDGVAPGQVGAGIAATGEFQALHAGQSDTAFVESLYANGLGRPGEPGGVAGWVDALQTGAMSRGDVLIAFAQSEEGQHHLYWAL